MRTAALALTAAASLAACHVSLSHRSSMVFDESVHRDEQHALELAPGERLILATDFGKIHVTAREGATPELSARVSASGRTEEEAWRVLERYQVRLERTSGGLKAELVGEPLRIDGHDVSATVSFDAVLPSGTALEAASGSGSVVTEGTLGELRLHSDFGKLEIDAAQGDVHARTGSGKISARRLAGGSADLNSGFGAIQVGEALLERLAVETGSGSVRIESGSVKELEIESGFGTIQVDATGGAVRAHSGSGSVTLRGVAGPVHAGSDFGNVVIEGVLTDLHATTGSGSVRVEARPGSSNASGWKLSSSFGSVLLTVPADFACRIDASTSFGSVECDFPVTIEAGERKGTELRGTIGGGGGTVTLSSGSGAVRLKKL